jgi:hypothetical protein
LLSSGFERGAFVRAPGPVVTAPSPLDIAHLHFIPHLLAHDLR